MLLAVDDGEVNLHHREETALAIRRAVLAGFEPDAIRAGLDGAGEFDDEEVAGALLYAITPDLSVRYDF